MQRVEGPTLCPENVELIWWIFWLEKVFAGWLDLCPSFLWMIGGTCELWEPQPESEDDLSDGISSQNMTTRLSVDLDVIEFLFLDLDFRHTPNILYRPSDTSNLKKHYPFIPPWSCSCSQAHTIIILIPLWEWEGGKKVPKWCCKIHQV